MKHWLTLSIMALTCTSTIWGQTPIPTARPAQTDRTKAMEVLALAETAAEAEPHSSIKAELFASIAAVYLKIGENKKGDALIARALPLIELSDNPAQNCDECFGKYFYQVLFLIDLLQAGHTADARVILEKMATRPSDIPPSARVAEYLADLAILFDRVGDRERARTMLADAVKMTAADKDNFAQSDAFKNIAIRYAQIGEMAEGLRVAGNCDAGVDRDRAMIVIARAFLGAGNVSLARDLATKITVRNFAPEIYIMIARWYFQQGKRTEGFAAIAQAKVAIAKADAGSMQNNSRVGIARLLISAGEYRASEEFTVGLIPYEKRGFIPLLLRNGERRRAEIWFKEFEQDYRKRKLTSF